MLTDTALRNLKPKSRIYKASDRDGMYVAVSPTGAITFRYDYRLNGRRETLSIGRYGPAGISLAMAREMLLDAKRAVAQGVSPALEKQRAKRRLTAVKTFGEMQERWLADARMADSTRAMRRSIIDRDILPVFRNRRLTEIAPDDLRVLCTKVKSRGAPATAVHIRDIVKQVCAFAVLHGEKVARVRRHWSARKSLLLTTVSSDANIKGDRQACAMRSRARRATHRGMAPNMGGQQWTRK